MTGESSENCRIEVLQSAGFFDVAFSVGLNLNHLLVVDQLYDTNRFRYGGVDWKLRIKRMKIEDGYNMNGFRCALMSMASETDDWSCAVNKHVLAWKPYDSAHAYYRQRPPDQYVVVGKRMMDGYAGYFFDVSNAAQDENGDVTETYLDVSTEDAKKFAGSTNWLTCELYIRYVGPISFYPTYAENYDFGKIQCVSLHVTDKNGSKTIFKVPLLALTTESLRFKSMVEERNGSDEPLDVHVACRPLDVRAFLQCLLPPYMPVDKNDEDCMKMVIGFADEYNCPRLLGCIQEFLIQTGFFSPITKIMIASHYQMRTVVGYALQQITDDDLAAFMQSDDYHSISMDTQIMVLKRLGDVAEM